MKTITKYNYLLRTLNQHRTEYSKIKVQIDDTEYNKLYNINNTTNSYSYSYSYTNNSYTYSYTDNSYTNNLIEVK